MCSDCEGGVACGDVDELSDLAELAAHLRDAGDLTRCADPRCGEPAADECEFCGKSLCAGGADDRARRPLRVR